MNLDCNSWQLLEIYEQMRDRQSTIAFPRNYESGHDLGPLIDRYDAFFFDAFGVLNIGDSAIPGTAERIAELRAAGRHVGVVSNADSVKKAVLQQRYAAWGYDFSEQEITVSRDALRAWLAERPEQSWGVMAIPGSDFSDLKGRMAILGEDAGAFDDTEGIILLTTLSLDEALRQRLLHSLQRRPRPVLLANPDLAAPREDGFTLEPGYIAWEIMQKTACIPIGLGKPHAPIFEQALQQLPPGIRRERVLMIGDTLHTDIAGACHCGLHSALVTGRGFCSDLDWKAAIAHTGIVPHHVLWQA